MLEPAIFSYLEELGIMPLWLRPEEYNRLLPTQKPLPQAAAVPAVTAREAVSVTPAMAQPKAGAATAKPATTAAADTGLTFTSLLAATIPMRSHFFHSRRGRQSLLIGFLATRLGQTFDPFTEKYGKLLQQLCSQLGLSPLQPTANPLITQKTADITAQDYKAVIFFSSEFKTATELSELNLGDIPCIFLPHPLVLLRNPTVKADYWHKLINIPV